jgi:hypothetical protein
LVADVSKGIPASFCVGHKGSKFLQNVGYHLPEYDPLIQRKTLFKILNYYFVYMEPHLEGIGENLFLEDRSLKLSLWIFFSLGLFPALPEKK